MCVHPPSPHGGCGTEVLQGDPESPNPSPGGSAQAVLTLSKHLRLQTAAPGGCRSLHMNEDDNCCSKTKLLSPEGQVLPGPFSSPLRHQAQGSFWHSAVSGGPPAAHRNWVQQLAGAGASPTHVRPGTRSQKPQAAASTDWQASPLCVSNQKHRTSDLLVHQENIISQCFSFHHLSGAVRCNLQGFGLGEVLERKRKWRCCSGAPMHFCERECPTCKAARGAARYAWQCRCLLSVVSGTIAEEQHEGWLERNLRLGLARGSSPSPVLRESGG